MQRMVQWESFGELKVFKLLDCDPEVKSFSEQPFTIHYRLAGRWWRHYPDLLVKRHHSMEICEVKTERDAQGSEFQERTAFLDRELKKLGFKYRVIDRTDFDDSGRLAHAETLLRFGRCEATLFERELIRRLLANDSALTWQAAYKGEYGPKGCQVLCRLVLEGKLQVRQGLLPLPDAQFVWRKDSN